jgi:alkanesulfonate monooxygenase SsuD/methylene tetrahydromethanopterin reductase-like flavin-dependent oxidoreductase (luciferase family)
MPSPKPYGGTCPLIMNAGASPTGQAFVIRNCDALFSNVSRGISFAETVRHVANVKALARQCGREIDVYTVGVVRCRPAARGFGRGSAALSRPDGSASYFAPAASPRAYHRNTR